MVHPRGNRQQQDRGNTKGALQSQLTALQGATLAFNNNAHSPKPAVSESRGGMRSPSRPETPNDVNINREVSPESSPERYAGSVKDRIKKFTDNHGSTYMPRVSRDDAMDHRNGSETPQWIAAQLAAERSATRSPSPAPPLPANRGNGLRDIKTGRQNTSSAYSGENSSSTSLQDIKARKPVRPVSQRSSAGEATGSSKNEISSPATDLLDKGKLIPSRTLSPPGHVNNPAKLTSEILMPPREATVSSPGDPSKSPRNRLEPIQDRKDEPNPPLPKRTNTSTPKSSLFPTANPSERTTDIRNASSRPTTSRSPPKPGEVPEPTLSRVRSQNHSRTSLKPQNSGMTDDSISDAIAASSLASSRAPSPSRNQPPPPPPKRGTRSRSFLHPHSSRTDDSRTPSPTKGLRETMRMHTKSDEEEDHPKKHSRRRIIKTHPHKHNEGGRKRWRDQINEKERKRYDGVWAANRGLWILPGSTKPNLSSSDKVLNLVVREIWSRSRLPGSVLEQVWGLVDRQGDGMLAREEFVVGMWLIDQRLKGRKLPIKVSTSVWESVRQISGTNMSSLI